MTYYLLIHLHTNSTLFHFFPVSVVEKSWKNQMSGNFVFSSWKMGIESRGTRRDPEGVEMGCTPAWDPHFSTRKHKITRIWFFQLFFATWLVKKRNRCLFLIFSTFWPPGPTPGPRGVPITFLVFISSIKHTDLRDLHNGLQRQI